MSKAPSCGEPLQGGPRGTIWAVELKDGACPADDFLKSLETRARAQFKARFEALSQTGTLRTPDFMRVLQVTGSPKVYEIKVDHGPGWRLYLIRLGTSWYATHGCKKPKDRTVAKEAEKSRVVFAKGGGSE